MLSTSWAYERDFSTHRDPCRNILWRKGTILSWERTYSLLEAYGGAFRTVKETPDVF
ncbi:hypothetical protein BDP27DRAFT_1336239 [Rhodocollybia butyracea]|uniref:Uncharacterized protein n=1 Tax=Rhodocollybia butyracea TaxID=206335 RepID=A0A9P5PIJ6_9AGAR|nr:hypothetical protein BDP27DRAFT_1336239 [Rhodocollybia butyracea]